MRAAVERYVLRYVTATGLVCGITLVYMHLVHVKHMTIALTFFLAVIVTAAWWGLAVALYLAVLSSLAFSYCFFPPIGSLANSDPQDWVAIFVFLGTAMIASRLFEGHRRRAETAHRRCRELEQLYGLAQRLVTRGKAADLVAAVPCHIVDAFHLHDAALFVASSDKIYHYGATFIGADKRLKAAMDRTNPDVDSEEQLCFAAVRKGAHVVGSIGIAGGLPSRETLDAISALTAKALEGANVTWPADEWGKDLSKSASELN
jgi:K+-sensing histidine kinase KdpD